MKWKHKILNWFGYRLITISSGSGVIITDYGLTSYTVTWKRFTTIRKIGTRLFIDINGNIFKGDDRTILRDNIFITQI